MASSIQILRSTQPQERPFSANLLEGQPAANLHSSEPGLFFKTTDGSVVKFGPAAITSDGSPPNSSPSGSAGNSTGELWLDKSADPPVLKVYDGTAWIDAGSGGGGGGTASYIRWIYTAIGGETSLSGSSGGVLLEYTPGAEEVYINGVLITRGSDYSASNGASITNLQPLTSGDVVTVLSLNPVDTLQLPGTVTVLRWSILSTAGQTVLSGVDSSGQQLSYTPGFEEVYVNGAFLRRGVDYAATDGLTITGLSPLKEDDEITVMAWSAIEVGSIDVPDGSITNVKINASAAIDSSKLSFLQAGTGAQARPVEDKLREVVSVKDFGAAGDASTDDTAAIQAALDYCQRIFNPGDNIPRTCHMPAGTYVISGPLTVYDRTNLVGDGSQNTRITALHTDAPILRLVNVGGGLNSNINLSGLKLIHFNVPSVAKDTYTDASGIRAVNGIYSSVWEDIVIEGSRTGVEAVGALFDMTMDNITAAGCYLGFDLSQSYNTSLDAKLVCYSCFHGIAVDGAYYSTLGAFVDFCGFSKPEVASFCSDSTIMPIGLLITQSFGFNLRWYGSENTNAILLAGSYFEGTVSGWSASTTAAYEWSEDATRTSNIPLDRQAVFSLYSSKVTFTDFSASSLVSGGYSPAASKDSALFYLGNSKIHMSGAPKVNSDAYYFSKDSEMLYLKHNSAAYPILGMQHPNLTFDSNADITQALPYGTLNESPMGPPLLGRGGQVYSANEPLTGGISSSISISQIILPDSPQDFEIKLIKETNFNACNIVPTGSNTFGPAGLTSIPFTSDGDYWHLKKVGSGRWQILAGHESGSVADGDYVRRSDGTASYFRTGFSLTGSGTSITSSTIDHPYLFANKPSLSLNLYEISGSEANKVSMYRAVNVGPVNYQINLLAVTGQSFNAATSASFDISASGKWY